MMQKEKAYLKLVCKVIIKYIISALCIAFLVEYLMTLNFSGLFAARRNVNKMQNYSIENIDLINSSLNGDRILAVQDDPGILLSNINDWVGTLIIQYDDITSSYLHIQLFCSNNGEAYSEENSINLTALENQRCLYVDINQQVTSLRIDFGDVKSDGFRLKKITLNPTLIAYAKSNLFNMSVLRTFLYFISFFVLFCMLHDYKTFLGILYKYRWTVGLGLIFLCTVFKLHGSSIGALPELLGGYNTSTLWGTPRSILSDEYVVSTGRALGQIKSGFEWFSPLFGYSQQDMYLIYGQPVYDFVSVFHPFSLGFLVLGAEYGLAFYWSSRLIIGFLVSFEFGRIITKDNRVLSVSYAFLLILSPLVQWWGGINELVELFLFGQLALIILYYYFRYDSIKKRSIMTAGLILSAGTYILTLYPARMIPLFYAFLACAVAILIENKSMIKIKKSDLIIWGIGITTLTISLIHVFSISGNTISVLMNTVYPGKREFLGGSIELFIELFRGWSSYIWSFVSTPNPCEEVGFINYYPLGIIFSLIIIFKGKIKDAWLISLNIFNALLTAYLLFKVPQIIGTLTLLGKSTERIYDAIGFINLLLCFRALLLIKNIEINKKFIILCTIFSSIISLHGCEGLINSPIKLIIVLMAVLSVLPIINFNQKKYRNIFVSFSIILSIVGGGLINPINSGLTSIYNWQILQQIEVANTIDEGMWVCGEWHLENLPTAVGAKALNVTETYPDIQLWTALGLEASEELWNRYHHTSVEISDSTYLELLGIDLVLLHVTIDKLREIGVKYIVTYQNLENYEEVVKISTSSSGSIYKIQ